MLQGLRLNAAPLLALGLVLASACGDDGSSTHDSTIKPPWDTESFDSGGVFVDIAAPDTGGGDAIAGGDTGVGTDAGPVEDAPPPVDTADVQEPVDVPEAPDVPVTPDVPPADVVPNDPPTIEALPLVVLKMGQSTTLDLAPLIADTEDDDSALALSWKAEHVAMLDPGTHVLLIVAPSDWHGTEVIPVTVTDSGGLTATQDLSVQVNEPTTEPPPPPDPEDCGVVTFSYDAAPGVGLVLLAGSFNGWAATPDTADTLTDPDGDGTWELSIELPPGTHQYKFIVDGVWMADPGNPSTVDDGFGGVNSVIEVEDCGEPPPPTKCGETTFTYDAAPGVSQVLLSGSFNEWGDKPETAWPMDDLDGAGPGTTFEVTVLLEPGTYQYKLIVDGEWVVDPNADTVPNEFGGQNNVVVVKECAGGLMLVSQETDPDAKSFEATFEATEVINPSSVVVTVDQEAALPSVFQVTADGLGATLLLTGLPVGIHDVRVTSAGTTMLLKVYLGVSTDWRDALLYFALTDRFANGDPTNDAPVPDVDSRTNYQGGDFAGITQRIESGYFDALGVSAIWVSWPIDNPGGYEDGSFPDATGCGLDPKTVNQSPMRYTAYHGYWPSQLDEVEEHFGTLADLQELVVAAHAHGIRVLLDFTANHVHDSSPFFAAHKDDGTFNFPAEICQNVGWDTKPETCWFTDYLPDLDYGNPAARKAMIDSAFGWVRQTGADGFRLDAVKHIAMSFVTELRARAKAELELTGIDFYIVGETFTGDAGLIQSFVGPNKIHGQFDFPSNQAIVKAIARQETGLDGMDQAVRGIKGAYGGGALMSTFIGNHDVARFLSHAAGSIPCGVWDVTSNVAQGWKSPPGAPSDEDPYRKLRIALTYAFTIPGIPLIYYGDEMGMPGAGDPDNRRMMRFGGALSGNEAATLAFSQKLGKARASYAALRKGEWTPPLWSEGDFLAYGRVLGDEKAIVLLHMGTGAKTGSLDVGALGLGDGAVLTDVLGDGGTQTVSGGKLPFTMNGRSASIFVND